MPKRCGWNPGEEVEFCNSGIEKSMGDKGDKGEPL